MYCNSEFCDYLLSVCNIISHLVGCFVFPWFGSSILFLFLLFQNNFRPNNWTLMFQALDTFNTAIVSPIYYVMFTTLTILASVIMFKVKSSQSWHFKLDMSDMALVYTLPAWPTPKSISVSKLHLFIKWDTNRNLTSWI